MKTQSAWCNISVIESGKHPWQCGQPANHNGPCAPYVPGSRNAPPTITTYTGTTSDLPINGCECDNDLRFLYIWLIAITAVMLLMGAVLAYCSIMVYRISQGIT